MDLHYNQITFQMYFWPGFKSVYYLSACRKGHQCCMYSREYKENTSYTYGTKIQ